MRVLIFGLPGSGKTTLASKLKEMLHISAHLNADKIRSVYNDWDFSEQGRIRQAVRMSFLSHEAEKLYSGIILADFVAPTEAIRKIFNADVSIWMNTINKSRFEDTNTIFELPNYYDIEIDNFEYDVELIYNYIDRKFKNDSKFRH